MFAEPGEEFSSVSLYPQHSFCLGESEIVAHNLFPILIGITWAIGGGLTEFFISAGTAAVVASVANEIMKSKTPTHERHEEPRHESSSTKQRNKPPVPDPAAEGNPHSIIEKPGKDGQYTTHNGDGTYKQYRGSGKDHGPMERPNVKYNELNTNKKTGQSFPGKPKYRYPESDEFPKEEE